MPRNISRAVLCVAFCTFATASLADSGGQAPAQQTAVQNNQAAYGNGGFGQNVASKSGKAPGKTASTTTCTSFGDYLQMVRGAITCQ